MFVLSRIVSWCLRVGLPLAALGLHLVIVVTYARRWDHAAALTVFPFWAWGLLGLSMSLIAWIIGRKRFALGMTLLWLVTTIAGSDETRPLLRFGVQKPLVGLPPDENGHRLLRVVTLNCHHMNPIAAEEVLPWAPDIVLLQEAPSNHALMELAAKLYPDGQPKDHVAGGWECAVLTRGKIQGYITTPAMQHVPNLSVLPVKIELDGRTIHAVSVHLQGAVTNVSLHRLSTWELHYRNRLSRRAEMVDVRHYLEALQVWKSAPVVIGGDFNAPAGDAVYRELEPDLIDAFSAVGSGWGDTFPNSSPLLRIDHLYSNSQLKAIRARTVECVNSDHRMVVADFLNTGE